MSITEISKKDTSIYPVFFNNLLKSTLQDRLFSSVAHSWDQAAVLMTENFKELIPEFFFLPEFLINVNRFNFGITQNTVRVSDVELSLWAKSPRYFKIEICIFIASESLYISIGKHLNLLLYLHIFMSGLI